MDELVIENNGRLRDPSIVINYWYPLSLMQDPIEFNIYTPHISVSNTVGHLFLFLFPPRKKETRERYCSILVCSSLKLEGVVQTVTASLPILVSESFTFMIS